MSELPDPPGYSSVRSVLRILVRRKLVTHHEDGPRYVYVPAAPQAEAREHALQHVVRTFFGGSAEQAVAALLKIADANVKPSEIARLREQVRKTRESGR
jgi:predicted transcriptional regulator